MTITLENIRTAADLVEGAVVHTPTVRSATLSERSGAEVWLKLETLQYTGSFKERGALVKLSALTDEEASRGIIAVSAGNHAQGVAYHARRMAIPATIVMPRGTPFVKVEHTRRLGAEIILEGENLAAARRFASERAARDNLAFIHPYDDPHIIAGQGTIALEMLADAPDLDTLILPVGGGGLIAGNAIAAKALKPGIEIIGVESELYASMRAALGKGAPPAGGASIADGIAVQTPGILTQAIIKDLVDDVLVIDEIAIERAIHLMIGVERLVVEGAGAAPLAALLSHSQRFAGRHVGLVISGGNIDSRLLASILMRGLFRDGQMVRLRIEVRDTPGSLAKVTGIVGECDANIVEILHQRLFYDVPVGLTEVDMVIETRGQAHVDEILTRLTHSGFNARLLSSRALEKPAAQIVAPR